VGLVDLTFDMTLCHDRVGATLHPNIYNIFFVDISQL